MERIKTNCYVSCRANDDIDWCSSWVSKKVDGIIHFKPKKFYWTVQDLEPLGYLDSQKAWDDFKKTEFFRKYETPCLIKWILISRWIKP